MDKAQIKQKIQEKWPNDYMQEHTLEVTLEDITKFSAPLLHEFENFLETGEPAKMEIEGWNYEKLTKERGLHPVGAFITLDWLLREPEEAKKALERGFDSIIQK
jgi:hypothetical protein